MLSFSPLSVPHYAEQQSDATSGHTFATFSLFVPSFRCGCELCAGRRAHSTLCVCCVYDKPWVLCVCVCSTYTSFRVVVLFSNTHKTPTPISRTFRSRTHVTKHTHTHMSVNNLRMFFASIEQTSAESRARNWCARNRQRTPPQRIRLFNIRTLYESESFECAAIKNAGMFARMFCKGVHNVNARFALSQTRT